METNNKNYLVIQQYLNGVLDEKAMHELEKQALDDPFLADALEGYAQTEVPVGKQLSILQTQLQDRIAQQQNTKNVLSFSWQRLSIAAAAGLLFVTASILFWIKSNNANRQLASNENEKQVEVNLTPSDSLNNSAELPLQDIAQSAKPSSVQQENTEIKVVNKKKAVSGELPVPAPEIARIEENAKTFANPPVEEKELEEIQSASVNQALQGRVAGVTSDFNRESISSAQILSERSLSEVAVKSGVAPLIGWGKYNEYLQSNTKPLSIQNNGFVVLSFVVNQNGTLKNLKVEKSLNEQADAEAIRVVKDGPLWQRVQDSTGTVSVKFGIEK